MIGLIDEPNRSICLKILSDNKNLFVRARGSFQNHQAWEGGYLDHITEVMNIAILLYGSLGSMRSLSFSLSDALFILFLHDIEKPWKYKIKEGGKIEYVEELKTKEVQHNFRKEKLKEYNIELTPEQENAFAFTEGEKKDYTSFGRSMNPLAAFCHLCDTASARIWFDYPKKKK